MRREILLMAVVMAVLLLAAGNAAAEKEEGTTDIVNYDAIIVEIDNTDGGNLNIEYDVRVLNGSQVNIWFLDEPDMASYALREPFNYYLVWSEESTRSEQVDWSWDEKGTFYIVIDTLGLGKLNETTTVKYKVTWSTDSVSNWLDYLSYCTVAVVIGILVLVVLARIGSKLKGEESQEVPPPEDTAQPPLAEPASPGLPVIQEPRPPPEAPPYMGEDPYQPPR